MSDRIMITREHDGQIHVITINRPEKTNAVDRETALLLCQAFTNFETDSVARVAILTSVGPSFCAGADLGAISDSHMNVLNENGSNNGPMGPTRLRLSKPVIAAVSGYAVAGGLELACWCTLRVATRDAIFGVFCRRFGVPLIDGGTVRLPKLIGYSRAMDMILTGRSVDATTAYEWGLVNRLVNTKSELMSASLVLARQLCSFPQLCMRSDYLSATEATFGQDYDFNVPGPIDQPLHNEFVRGIQVIKSGETMEGATRFAESKEGRHGQFQALPTEEKQVIFINSKL